LLEETKGAVAAAKSLVKGDGCTAAPDFWWTSCCDEHDTDYIEKKMSRAAADKKFHRCLRAKAKTFIGKWFLSPIYYLGVRIAGKHYWDNAKGE
jgi:hypothetical protein